MTDFESGDRAQQATRLELKMVYAREAVDDNDLIDLCTVLLPEPFTLSVLASEARDKLDGHGLPSHFGLNLAKI